MSAPELHGYRITKAADADLDAIYDYTFDTWGEQQAEKYLTLLHAAFKKLTVKPMRGKPRPALSKTLLFFAVHHHIVV